jgi:acyl-CoA synthetase (AMP-forming)/AMP-acid ligase II
MTALAFDDTAGRVGNPYLSRVFGHARRDAERAFAFRRVASEWRVVTRGEFFARVEHFARLLRARDTRPGDVVPIILRHDVDAHAAFLRAMWIGAVPSYLPFPNSKHDHGLYWSQHRALLDHVRPRVVLVYDDLADDMERLVADLGIRVVTQSSTPDVDLELPEDFPAADTIALLQHSSGTTGAKKGVALTYRAIEAQLNSYSSSLGLGAREDIVIASWLPLYHDMGLMTSFLLPILRGYPIVMIDPFEWVASPALLFEGIERFRATHAWLPNFAFLHLARMVPRKRVFDLSSVEALVSCSEPCKPATFDAFLARFSGEGMTPSKVGTCYAMAETVFAISQSERGAPPKRLSVGRRATESFGRVHEVAPDADDAVSLLSNGRPISGCEVAVLVDGVPAGEWMAGELAVGGEFLFSGYYKNEEATEKSRAGSWHLTGDVGFLADGEVFVLGRLKEIIIVNGKNVFANDVEEALLGLPGLKAGRSVAFGSYNDRLGSEQLILVAETDGSDHAPTELMAAVNRRVIEAVGVPCGDVKIVPQGWLVKTTSGKISRAENMKRYAEMRHSPGPAGKRESRE